LHEKKLGEKKEEDDVSIIPPKNLFKKKNPEHMKNYTVQRCPNSERCIMYYLLRTQKFK